MKYCVHSVIDPERWPQVNHSGAKRFGCNPWVHTCFKLKPFWRMNFCLSKAWKVMMMRMRRIASEKTKLQILADVYKLEGHSPLPFPCLLLLGWLITIFFWPSSADIKRQHKFGSPWNQPDLRSIFFSHLNFWKSLLPEVHWGPLPKIVPLIAPRSPVKKFTTLDTWRTQTWLPKHYLRLVDGPSPLILPLPP